MSCRLLSEKVGLLEIVLIVPVPGIKGAGPYSNVQLVAVPFSVQLRLAEEVVTLFA